MNNVVFTICAKNYIGLAKTLEESVKRYNPKSTFLIFISDEICQKNNDIFLDSNILIAKEVLNISERDWTQMSFKYDLTEFCTSIKPKCFEYIFNKCNAETCIYLDPDILVFNSFECIYNKLKNFNIFLTPHITNLQINYTGFLNEQRLLYSGMYNLGFLALKNSKIVTEFLNWWHVRLIDRCFQNQMESYFTDQKWIDFIPALLPNDVHISNDLGLNIAPWNFHEREVFELDNIFYVKCRNNPLITSNELIFIHFSGFDYLGLVDNKIQQNNIKGIHIYEDLIKMFHLYKDALIKNNFDLHFDLSYTYNYFSNENQISSIHRKLFRRIHEDNLDYGNPFLANSLFYKLLNRKKLISKRVVLSQKYSINNVSDIKTKTHKINLLLKLFYKIVGPAIYFQIVRLMRVYSKIENHIFIIDESYKDNFNIRH